MIEQLRALVADDLAAVNDLIYTRINSDLKITDNLAKHILNSGGKRLRPLLVLLVGRALGNADAKHIKLAALFELFHTATLLHDDVVDESTLRRGVETAHEIWGRKASILVGDYILTIFMQLMMEISNETITNRLVVMTQAIVNGELQQLANRYNPLLTVENYFAIIKAKTSMLFAEAAASTAILSLTPASVHEAFFAYGLHLGNAFQLIDDSLDYCSDSHHLGKNIGDDLADGKLTMPLLRVLEVGSLSQQELVKQVLTNGSINALPEVLAAIKETGAIEYTRQIADNEVNKAIAAISQLLPSEFKDALIALAQYAVLRDR